MSDAQHKALTAYFEIGTRNGASHVFRTATQLGIFAALTERQMQAGEIAQQCKTQLRPTQLILDALCAMNVVEKYGEDYALAPVMHLLTEHDRTQGDDYWQYLAEFTRTGTNPLLNEKAEGNYRSAAASVQWVNTPAAITIAGVLELGTTRRELRILDLGASTGVWSLTLLHNDPSSRVTLVDTPDVLETAERMAAEIGMADRVTTIAGDYREVDIPERAFDLVLLNNLCHVADDESLGRLIRRAHRALDVAGELAIVDTFPGHDDSDDKSGHQDDHELQRALFALGVAIRTRHGRLRTIKELARVIAGSGFAAPSFARLPDAPGIRGLMLAKKQ